MRLIHHNSEGANRTLRSPGRRRLLRHALGLASLPMLSTLPARADTGLKLLKQWPSANPTLYPFSLDDEQLFLNGDATLEAHDWQSGARHWQVALDEPAVFRPRLTKELVIASGRKQLGGWQRVDGAARWQHLGKRELGVPLLHRDRLHLGEGHRLITLDANTGEPLWQFNSDASARIGYAPTADRDTIYLGAGDGVLYALDAASGEPYWQVDREKDWQYLRQLAVSGELLIAGGYHDEMFGLDKHSGRIRWRFNAGNFINSQLVTTEAIYFWSPTGWVYALETSSGKVIWRHRTINYSDPANPANWAPIMAEMVAVGDHLYVLAMDNVLHLLDRHHGKELARYRMPAPMRPFITLQASGRHLFTGGESGEIYHLELT